MAFAASRLIRRGMAPASGAARSKQSCEPAARAQSSPNDAINHHERNCLARVSVGSVCSRILFSMLERTGNVSRSTQAFACALAFFALSVVPLRADLVVNVGSTTIAPGSTGTVDITVTSTTGADTLSAFGLELQITGVGTPAALLQFSMDQPTPYGNVNYVFFGQSSNNDFGLPLWSPPFTTNYNNDTITGGDSNDGNGSTPGYVTIPSSAGGAYTYLASVQFFLPVGGTSGDQYKISLVNSPGQTYFDDQNNNPLSYTSSSGLVTVEGIASVPEPSSLLVVVVSALGGLIWHYSRGRRGLPNDTEASRIHVGNMR